MARDGQGPVPGRIAERDSQARIQVGPHVPVDSSWAARARQLELEGPAPASQSQSPGMTGRTGSESWGRSHVGEAVDINLVMHSVSARPRRPALSCGPGGGAAGPGIRCTQCPSQPDPAGGPGANRFILCLQSQADSSSPDDACGRAFSALRAGLPEPENVFRISSCCTR